MKSKKIGDRSGQFRLRKEERRNVINGRLRHRKEPDYTWRRGGRGEEEDAKFPKILRRDRRLNPKREEGGIDYIVVKGGTGGKYKNVKDKMYMERKRSNNAAEIV